MTPRYEPNVLEMALQRSDWSPERDPSNLCLPMKGKTHQPTCHCPPQGRRARLGGCKPAISLSDDLVVCRTCRKPIPSSNKTRDAKWLQGLLKVKLNQPNHFDAESLRPEFIVD